MFNILSPKVHHILRRNHSTKFSHECSQDFGGNLIITSNILLKFASPAMDFQSDGKTLITTNAFGIIFWQAQWTFWYTTNNINELKANTNRVIIYMNMLHNVNYRELIWLNKLETYLCRRLHNQRIWNRIYLALCFHLKYLQTLTSDPLLHQQVT